MQKTWVQSLGWEDPLEKGKATHSSILAYSNDSIVHGVPKIRTQLSDSLSLSLSYILRLIILRCIKDLNKKAKSIWILEESEINIHNLGVNQISKRKHRK